MKKAALLLTGIVLTLSLAACGKSEEDGNAQTPSTTEQTTETTTEPAQTNPTGEGSTDVVYGDADLEELKAAVVEVLGENYWPDMTVEADMLSDMYGVTEDMYEAYIAEVPMISANVDTLIIVKAKEDQVEAVEAALNAYREKMVDDTMQYPMNVGKIQASRIEAIGNYVCFVQLGADVMEASDQGDEAVITQCQEANESALDAIRNKLLQ